MMLLALLKRLLVLSFLGHLEKSPWLNSDCLLLMEEKEELEEAYREDPSSENKDALQTCADKLRYALTSLRKFWAEQIDSVDDFLDCEDFPLGE